VRISDGDDERLCLVTGDWTLRDAGGTPGLPVEELPQVDALFLTTATATGVSETLTDVVATTLERASAGAPTLVTANGLTGAHLARLLDRAANGFGIQVPVRVVGHTARLYRQLYGAGAAGPCRRPHRTALPAVVRRGSNRDGRRE
jgi:putative mRNA 3-end processing factor